MIDEKINHLADGFFSQCITSTAGLPEYTLDNTWPTVGTLDLMTFPLRRKLVYDSRAMMVLRSVAAYLGRIAYHSWSLFPDDVTLSLSIDKSNEYEVLLTAQGGKYLERNESFTVRITEALKQVLSAPALPFPVFEKMTRMVNPDGNFISLFGLGLCSGLCPFGKGAWRKQSSREFLPYLLATESLLASMSAEYYKRVYPHEECGQKIELYLQNLIFPPIAFDEPFPVCRAITNIITYLKHIDIPPSEMADLALNLSSSPDELLSCVGFALAVALTGEEPSAKLIAIGEAKTAFTPELRPAVVLARKLLDRPHDFLESIALSRFGEAAELARIESAVGLLPLFHFSPKHFSQPTLWPLIQAIAWNDARNAREVIESLSPAEVPEEILLQGIFLDIWLRNVDRAEEELQSFLQVRSENHPLLFRAFELQGMVALLKEDIPGAVKSFLAAKKTRPKECEPRQILSIGNNLAWSLMLTSDFKRCLEEIDQVLAYCPHSVTCKLNRSFALRGLEREVEADEELEELSRYAAMDKRVFFGLLLYRAEKGKRLQS